MYKLAPKIRLQDRKKKIIETATGTRSPVFVSPVTKRQIYLDGNEAKDVGNEQMLKEENEKLQLSKMIRS